VVTYDAIFDALGDQTRRLVFDKLRNGPASVATLAAGLPISRPAVSQHLKILKQAGLAVDDAIGARRVYRLNSDGLADLRAWLDGFQTQAPDDYEAEIQRQMDERKNT
jgi:DNA-binding transcriptional ArsR family regulator